jgi:hypothetical protein
MNRAPAEGKKGRSRKPSKKAVEIKKRGSRTMVKQEQLDLFPIDPSDTQVTYTTKAKRPKKFEEYKRSKPAAIKVFEYLASEGTDYSNTIELYDFIPKHFWGKEERIDGKYLPALKREFECRGVKYTAIIAPASIEDKDGQLRAYYLGRREEIIEAALRKMACDGKGEFLDDMAGVVFSLTDLWEELKEMKHTYSLDQIKEALLICAKTNIEVKTADGNSILVSNIFRSLCLRTWEDWQDKGQQTKCVVQFNSLVTDSIKSGAFRRFNYKKFMSYDHVIARQLYKRLSHHYIQASMANTYEILLSTMIRDFGLTYTRFRDSLYKVESALKELMDTNVILKYTIEKILELMDNLN